MQNIFWSFVLGERSVLIKKKVDGNNFFVWKKKFFGEICFPIFFLVNKYSVTKKLFLCIFFCDNGFFVKF